jgi:predicted porin
MIYSIKYLMHKFNNEGNHMNFKKTALSTAVGATLAISGVAQAAMDGPEVSVYGRINNAINVTTFDVAGGGDADATNVVDVVSRIGAKASAPINDDLTAFGRFEFSAVSDSEGTGIGDTRVAEVGVRGDNFGTLKIGNMWSTFYNMVGTHLDPTVTVGAVLYSSIADLPYRVSNAIQYSNDFGPVSFSAEIRVSDEDNPDDSNSEKIGGTDGNAIGASFSPVENLVLAFAVDSSDAATGGVDVDRTGFAAKYTMGMFWGSIGYGQGDYDGVGKLKQTQLHVGGDFGDGVSGFIGYGVVKGDPDSGPSPDDAKATTLNITKKFGKSGFRVYYEGIFTSDSDDLLGGEQTTHIAGARIDF